ncbi:MAG: hypothetical protein HKN03_00075 [Acidimicrobiales bacterium]|nr:hypothetical protein [Acidimicrobiales bacterium]
MKAFTYGRVVDLPHVDLPLVPAPLTDPPVVTIAVGIPSSPGALHELDEAVSLHIADATSAGSVRVTVVPRGSLGPRSLEHYIVDHAIPTALTVVGDLVLHAAAVQSPGGVGFLLSGASGAGKSTTSAHLSRAGWTVLSDDGVRLDVAGGTVAMWSSYAGIRLHTDVLDHDELSVLDVGDVVAEYGTKRRVQPHVNSDPTVPATAAWFVELGDDGPVGIEPLGSAAVCSRMTEQMFFPSAGPADAFRRLDLVAPLAECLRGVRLSFPRTSAGVQEAVSALTDLVGEP